MKHMKSLSKKSRPAQAASLLAKEHMIANVASAFDALDTLFGAGQVGLDLFEDFINKPVTVPEGENT